MEYHFISYHNYRIYEGCDVAEGKHFCFYWFNHKMYIYKNFKSAKIGLTRRLKHETAKIV